MINESKLAASRIVSIPLKEDLYQKIEKHALQNGENVRDCIAAAVSEAVELWDDYDRILGTLNIKDSLPLF